MERGRGRELQGQPGRGTAWARDMGMGNMDMGMLLEGGRVGEGKGEGKMDGEMVKRDWGRGRGRERER